MSWSLDIGVVAANTSIPFWLTYPDGSYQGIQVMQAKPLLDTYGWITFVVANQWIELRVEQSLILDEDGKYFYFVEVFNDSNYTSYQTRLVGQRVD